MMRRHMMPLGNIDGVLLACLARPLKSALQEKGRVVQSAVSRKRLSAGRRNWIIKWNSSIFKKRRRPAYQLSSPHSLSSECRRNYMAAPNDSGFSPDWKNWCAASRRLLCSLPAARVTCARLVPCCDEDLRLSGKHELAASLQLAMLAEVYEKGREGKALAFIQPAAISDYWTLPFSRASQIKPTVSTVRWAHGYRGLAFHLPAVPGSGAGFQ